MSDIPVENTDRELWRKGDGDGNGMSYYEPTIHVTKSGLIGIAVGGSVVEMPVETWHALASAEVPATTKAIGHGVSPHHQVMRSDPVTFTYKPTPPSGPPPATEPKGPSYTCNALRSCARHAGAK